MSLFEQIAERLTQLTIKQPPIQTQRTGVTKMTDQLPVTDAQSGQGQASAIVNEVEQVLTAVEPVVDAVATVVPQVAAVDPFLKAIGLVLSGLGHDADGIIGAATALAKLFK